MGPWPGDHGNPRNPGISVSSLELLQWGRGLVTTEIRLASPMRPKQPRFNGAVAW